VEDRARDEAEKRVKQRQAWIIGEKIAEMEVERGVCESMINTMEGEGIG
jgi:hypothetical protein